MAVARQACGCRDHTRSELLRTAAARAGTGLPSIEPGMPLPAGTGLDRRAFLTRTLGLAMAVYGAASLAPRALRDGIAAAAETGDAPVLVSVFLDGGMDSLSVLAPTGDARYASLRPTLALGSDEGVAFTEDPSLRWHPNAAPLATLHSEGKVTVFPAIGYTDANQSHFTSRHYWEVGELNPATRTGWLGRYLDQHGAPDNPLQGLSLGDSLMPALASASVPVAAVSPGDYDFWPPAVNDVIEAKMLTTFGELGSQTGTDALGVARMATWRASAVREEIQGFDGFTSPVPYPTGDPFPERLAALAAMLAAGLPLHCVSVRAPGGYDTHSDQLLTLPDNLRLTADSLLAFQRDLEARGLADRVLTHVWSEFGRRPRENDTGTDHGAGGLSLLIGSRASGTMVGDFPGLAQLDAHDNLLHTSDFRALYCALLEQWLGVDAAPIIPGASSFARPQLVR